MIRSVCLKFETRSSRNNEPRLHGALKIPLSTAAVEKRLASRTRVQTHETFIRQLTRMRQRSDLDEMLTVPARPANYVFTRRVERVMGRGFIGCRCCANEISLRYPESCISIWRWFLLRVSSRESRFLRLPRNQWKQGRNKLVQSITKLLCLNAC